MDDVGVLWHVAVCRLQNVDVSLMDAAALSGGTVCATSLSASAKGQMLSVVCPPEANATYLLIQRPSLQPVYLGMSEVQLYADSGPSVSSL